MKLLEKNMSFLKEKIPNLYSMLVDETFPGNIEPVADADNLLTARQERHYFMHDRNHQEQEIKNLLKQCPDDPHVIVLLGFGNGKAIEAIRNSFNSLKELIIIDPSPVPMLSFLQHTSFRDFFDAFYKVSFIINQSEQETAMMLENIIRQHGPVVSRICVLAHPGYQAMYCNYYESAKRAVDNAIRFNTVNIATTEKNRYLWLVNVWRNLRHNAVDIGCFENAFDGVPAILVSAGPSLNKNIHLLEQAKSKALIIAVGSAMTILQSHGIVPHFRVALDPNSANRQLFAKVDTANCPLIYSNRMFHGILLHYEGEKINMVFAADDCLERYILTRSNHSYMTVRSGFSVANSALDMLIRLKCSPIVLIGQDLCYTEGKLHAAGSWSGDGGIANIDKACQATDILGRQVFTTTPFLAMKSLFESIIAAAGHITVINATEGGLPIEGALNKALEQVLQVDLMEEYDLVGRVQKVLDKNRPSDDKRQQIGSVVDCIQQSAIQLRIRNQRIIHKLERILNMINQGVRRGTVQNEVKKVNTLIVKQFRNDFFKEVVYPIFRETLDICACQLNNLDKKDATNQVAQEIHLFLSVMGDIDVYLMLTEQLVLEFKGGHELIVEGME